MVWVFKKILNNQYSTLKLESHYRLLGRSILQRRDRQFWDYHREGLKNLGFPIDRAKLIKAAAKEFYISFMDGLSHPKATAQGMIRWVKKG